MTDPHDWTHPAPPKPYDSLELSRDILPNTKGVYALRVKGYSMIDALINDGDIVIMRKADTVEVNELAAVWIKSQEITTLRRVGAPLRDAWGNLTGKIELKPDNPTYEKMTVDVSDIQVQAKIEMIIRHV